MLKRNEMRKRIVLILTCIGVLGACKKYGHGNVQGTVTQLGSNLPAPHIHLYLRKFSKHQKDGAASFSSVVDSTVTDSHGAYHIPYYKERGYGFFIYPTTQTAHGGDHTPRSVDLYEKNETVDFQVDAVAYMRVHLKQTSTDSKRIELNFSDNWGNIKLPDHVAPFDTILPPFKIIGNYKIDFNWLLVDTDPNIPSVSHPDPIYVSGGDTLKYSITY